jgi:AcrR family transcriptional regulator
MALPASRRRSDASHRAQVGAARRARTRKRLLLAALTLFGRPQGRNTRIEDVCRRAQVARGTFYNHFDDLADLLEALCDALTAEFDAAVHATFGQFGTPAQRTAVAIRYYLHAPRIDARWGWALVNSSVGRHLYGAELVRHVRASIQEGIDAGQFRLPSVDVGCDLLLGTSISATLSVLGGAVPGDYPEQVARHLLLALGATGRVAAAATSRPLGKLPRLALQSEFFVGVLGGADRK